MEELYYPMLTGEPFEDDDGEIHRIAVVNGEPVFSKKEAKNFFDLTSEELKESSKLLDKEEYIILRGEALMAYSEYTGVSYPKSMYISVFTRKGMIKLASMFPNKPNSLGLVLAAFRLVSENMTKKYSVEFMIKNLEQVQQSTYQLLSRRVSKLDDEISTLKENGLPVPVQPVAVDSETIDVDRTMFWRDNGGFIHVNSMNRHVIGYYSMTEVAAKLNLYSESMNPHSELAENICRTALRIPYTSRQSSGDLWCTFKYTHYGSGKTHDKDCLRLTEEGMNKVTDWWIRHASEYTFVERNRHGYNFSKKFAVHPDIPLMESYKTIVNPVGGMQDNSIIDANTIESSSIQKYDENGRPDYTGLPFYDSRDQNPDGTWKE